MSKQLENTLAVFSRRTDGHAGKFLGGIVILFLLVGLFMAVAAAEWAYTSIFLVTLTAAGTLGWFGSKRMRELTAETTRHRLGWESAVPEIQRQNLDIEVRELSKILDIGDDQLSDVQSAYIVAEDLALREIQNNESSPLIRHITVGGVPFDAVMMQGETLVCIEVAFLITPDVRKERTDSIIRKIDSVRSALAREQVPMESRLMMVLVTQLSPEDETQLRSVLNARKFADTPVDIEIRLLDFEALQRNYVTD